MRQRGWSWKETLLAVAVLWVAAVLVIGITRRADQNVIERNDIANLRDLYAALAQYEELNDQLPAPDLLTVRRDMGEDSYYRASLDPYAKEKATQYPLEPNLPAWASKSPIRISYSYVMNFVQAGAARLPAWAQVRTDPKQGVLACSWYGHIQAEGNFKATSDGPILRVNSDGSVFRLEHRTEAQPGFEDLFRRR